MQAPSTGTGSENSSQSRGLPQTISLSIDYPALR